MICSRTAEEDRLSEKDFFVDTIVSSVEKDLDELKKFLDFIYNNIDESSDDKLHKLIELLESEELNGKKVIIFTEYRDTARYLYSQLKKKKLKGVIEELDSSSGNREEVIKRFAPYYNCTEEEFPRYLK